MSRARAPRPAGFRGAASFAGAVSLAGAVLALLLLGSCAATGPTDPEGFGITRYLESAEGGLSLWLSAEHASLFGAWEDRDRGLFGLAEGESKADGGLRLKFYTPGKAFISATFEGAYVDKGARIEGDFAWGAPGEVAAPPSGSEVSAPGEATRPLDILSRSLVLARDDKAAAGLKVARLRDSTREGLPKDEAEPTRFVYFGFELAESPELRTWYREAFQGGVPLEKAMKSERDGFFGEFVDSAKRLAEAELPSNPWFYEGRQFMAWSNERLTVMGLRYSGYTGGANATDAIRYAVIDRKERKNLGPADFLTEDWGTAAVPLVEQRARELLSLAPGAPLSAAGLFQDTLGAGGNFLVSSGGLGFHYNPYEIGPKTFGDLWVVIPWARLEKAGLLKPGVLEAYGIVPKGPESGR